MFQYLQDARRCIRLFPGQGWRCITLSPSGGLRLHLLPRWFVRDSPRVPNRQVHIVAGPRDWVLSTFVVGLALFGGVALLIDFSCARTAFLASSGVPLNDLQRQLLAFDGSPLQLLQRWIAYPVLAATFGFAVAQGSASRSAGVNYKLAKFYDSLSAAASRTKWPTEVTQFLNRFNERLASAQEARDALATAYRAAYQLALDEGVVESSEIVTQGAVAARTVAAFGFRRLVATLADAREDTEWRTLSLRFDGSEAAPKATFAQRDSIPVQFHCFGEGLDIDISLHDTRIPEFGPSDPVPVSVKFLAPQAVLRVFVTEHGSAEVLQEFAIPVRRWRDL